MTRPARLLIDLAALEHNFSRVRALAPQSAVISVVKADAYGHGLVRVAHTLAGSDAFGVACLEEALELRAAGIDKPVLLMEGPYSTDELAEIHRYRLDMVVHHEDQLKMLESCNLPARFRVWLKIDTGMHRLGIDPSDVRKFWKRLKECDVVDRDIRLMTHLADAGDTSRAMTAMQLDLFNEICNGVSGRRSVANSAGILAWPGSHADFVRPGLMLYGVSPIDHTTGKDHGLLPVMTLQSRLISTRWIKKGEFVGYGAEWSAPFDMRIGIVAAGYGDGFPRHASTGTPVMINGRRSRIIGNVSMDMLTIDLSNFPDANPGDPVELWGRELPVEEIAAHAGTISYELLCSVHKRLGVTVREPA